MKECTSCTCEVRDLLPTAKRPIPVANCALLAAASEHYLPLTLRRGGVSWAYFATDIYSKRALGGALSFRAGCQTIG